MGVLRLVGSLAVCAAVAAVIPTFGVTGNSRTRAVIPVKDVAEFDAKLAEAKAGDTIALADGNYPLLVVSHQKFSAPVTISGSRNAKVDGLDLTRSQNVVVRGLTITPPAAAPAVVTITGSTDVVLDGVLFDGRVESAGAGVVTDPTDTNITIENSEFTDCGKANRGRCVGTSAAGLRILHNAFHDCLDCDFIRGGGGSGAGTLIQGNTFNRAVRGSCVGGAAACNHNDHIQILSGGPWIIVGNRFGDRQGGAASIWIKAGNNNSNAPIHDVRIASDVFAGQSSGSYGIGISGLGGSSGPPKGVTIVNNTILSGSVSALRLVGLGSLAESQLPIVANNILGASSSDWCGAARTSHNLIEQGRPCPGDFSGAAKLDAAGAPTKASTLVIGRADPAYAPPTDFYGHARAGASPDIGAIQHLAVRRVLLTMTAPRRLTLSRAVLAKRGWRASVRVSMRGVVRLQTRMLVAGQTLLSLTRAVKGAAPPVTISFTMPIKARTRSSVVLSFRGTAADRRVVSRSTTLQLVR